MRGEGLGVSSPSLILVSSLVLLRGRGLVVMACSTMMSRRDKGDEKEEDGVERNFLMEEKICLFPLSKWIHKSKYTDVRNAYLV